jgi:hypothetical protein
VKGEHTSSWCELILFACFVSVTSRVPIHLCSSHLIEERYTRRVVKRGVKFDALVLVVVEFISRTAFLHFLNTSTLYALSVFKLGSSP